MQTYFTGSHYDKLRVDSRQEADVNVVLNVSTQKYSDLNLLLDNLHQISDYDYFLTHQDDSMVQNNKTFDNFAKVKNVTNASLKINCI